MWDVVRRLVTDGSTVLLTTQYLDEADALADEISVIDHGKVIAHDTPDGLKRSHRRPADPGQARPTAHRLDDVHRILARDRRQRATRSTGRDELTVAGRRRGAPSPPPSAGWPPTASPSPNSPCTCRRLDEVFLTLTGERVAPTEHRQTTTTEEAA